MSCKTSDGILLSEKPGEADGDLRCISFCAYLVYYSDENDHIVAVGNTLPLDWDGAIEIQPIGWEDAFERAVCDFDAGREPTTLCAIQAAVGRLLQGLSRMVLREMRHRAAQAGLFWLGGLQGSVLGLLAAGLGLMGLITDFTGVCILYLTFGVSTLEVEKKQSTHS